MGVPCPGCGRSYDVALFQFGRTIHCTCGRRVGVEPRVAPPRPGIEPRFAADAMLGRLARWLRTLGYDTTYDPAVEDAAIARLAIEEHRVLLTRDRSLPEEWRVPRVWIVEAEEPRAQLREVVLGLHLAWRDRLFRRCSVCNALLEAVSPEAAAPRVPPRIRREQKRFAGCPGCGRIYWEGSHTARMRRVLAELLE